MVLFNCERITMWKELLDLKEQFQIPFIVMGDYNEILKVGERCGNNAVTKSMA